MLKTKLIIYTLLHDRFAHRLGITFGKEKSFIVRVKGLGFRGKLGEALERVKPLREYQLCDIS